jgi:DNA polymerase III sliding clamp (beta) subunit (PCNA family)
MKTLLSFMKQFTDKRNSTQSLAYIKLDDTKLIACDTKTLLVVELGFTAGCGLLDIHNINDKNVVKFRFEGFNVFDEMDTFKYPDYNRIIPNGDYNRATISADEFTIFANQIIKALYRNNYLNIDYLRRFNHKGITLSDEVYMFQTDENQPVCITGEVNGFKFTCVLMPTLR